MFETVSRDVTTHSSANKVDRLLKSYRSVGKLCGIRELSIC
jgi:hypothetical protein